MKVQKKKYGASQRVKPRTIALIDRICPGAMPFDTKVYMIVKQVAQKKGVSITEDE